MKIAAEGIAVDLGRRCRDLYREYQTHSGARKAARLKLGEELRLARKALPWGSWEHWLDEWGINVHTANKAIREAEGRDKQARKPAQTPDKSVMSSQNATCRKSETGGDTFDLGPEIEVEDFSDLDLEDEEDEDGILTIRNAGCAQMALSTGETPVPRMAERRGAQEESLPVQMTLDAVYEAAQADLSRVERGMRGLLERVRDGDRAAATRMRAVAMMMDAPITVQDDFTLSPPTAAR